MGCWNRWSGRRCIPQAGNQEAPQRPPARCQVVWSCLRNTDACRSGVAMWSCSRDTGARTSRIDPHALQGNVHLLAVAAAGGMGSIM